MLVVTSDSLFRSWTGLGQNKLQKGTNCILTVKRLTKRTLSIIETLENLLSLLCPEDQSRTVSSFDKSLNLLHALPPNASGNLPFSLSLEGKLAKCSGARDINLGNLT